jgi:hypothetical protein
MIFIFGFRTRTAIMATLSLACRNGHIAAHRIVKRTRWFTLFFIPVIPFSRKYRSVCIQCGLTLEIPKAAAEEIAARSAEGGAVPNDPVSPPLHLPVREPGAMTPPAGWYPDPAGSNARRYWDGQAWTAAIEQH